MELINEEEPSTELINSEDEPLKDCSLFVELTRDKVKLGLADVIVEIPLPAGLVDDCTELKLAESLLALLGEVSTEDEAKGASPELERLIALVEVLKLSGELMESIFVVVVLNRERDRLVEKAHELLGKLDDDESIVLVGPLGVDESDISGEVTDDEELSVVISLNGLGGKETLVVDEKARKLLLNVVGVLEDGRALIIEEEMLELLLEIGMSLDVLVSRDMLDDGERLMLVDEVLLLSLPLMVETPLGELSGMSVAKVLELLLGVEGSLEPPLLVAKWPLDVLDEGVREALELPSEDVVESVGDSVELLSRDVLNMSEEVNGTREALKLLLEEELPVIDKIEAGEVVGVFSTVW